MTKRFLTQLVVPMWLALLIIALFVYENAAARDWVGLAIIVGGGIIGCLLGLWQGRRDAANKKDAHAR